MTGKFDKFYRNIIKQQIQDNSRLKQLVQDVIQDQLLQSMNLSDDFLTNVQTIAIDIQTKIKEEYALATIEEVIEVIDQMQYNDFVNLVISSIEDLNLLEQQAETDAIVVNQMAVVRGELNRKNQKLSNMISRLVTTDIPSRQWVAPEAAKHLQEIQDNVLAAIPSNNVETVPSYEFRRIVCNVLRQMGYMKPLNPTALQNSKQLKADNEQMFNTYDLDEEGLFTKNAEIVQFLKKYTRPVPRTNGENAKNTFKLNEAGKDYLGLPETDNTKWVLHPYVADFDSKRGIRAGSTQLIAIGIRGKVISSDKKYNKYIVKTNNGFVVVQ